MIKAKNIYKDFVLPEATLKELLSSKKQLKTVSVLKGLSVDVAKGECVGILGKNGSGKSTFLRCVGGVYHYKEGTVELDGECSSIYELGITGQLFFTGREFSKRYMALFSPELSEEDYISFVHSFSELKDFFDKPIYTYSSGMKARLFFSVATAKETPVYLIDEALAVGDANFQKKCWKLIKERLRNNASCLLVTHDWTIVAKLCQRVFIFENGRSMFNGRSFDGIVKYLGLSSGIGQELLQIDVPQSLYWNSSSDIQQDIKIKLNEDFQHVSFSFSLEKLDVRLGWIHVFHIENNVFKNIKRGDHTIRISIPKFPLSSGEYSLNIFIQADNKVKYGYSWTYGNEIKVHVFHPQESNGLLVMEN